MNPTGYPIENVQFQARNDGYPGPPVAPVAQYTTVNITSEAPSDYVVWSICSFIYLNPCCLGLAALIYSIKARDRKVAGDMNGARNHGSTARCLNIAAMILVSIMILIFIITLSVVVNQAKATIHYRNYY
ncbi:dispanin subfamily A member 2b-like [Clinocottus analis]|uniref:dispanin subfamily A member 2b-like n=1 Tax=Clinocottus analis TaxID=304258 RepID=UPI0035BFA1F9